MHGIIICNRGGFFPGLVEPCLYSGEIICRAKIPWQNQTKTNFYNPCNGTTIVLIQKPITGIRHVCASFGFFFSLILAPVV